MKARWSVLCAALLVPALSASAQAPAAASNAPPRDFSKAFDRLRQIGLPDVQGGTYMNLQTMSGRWSSRGGRIGEVRLHGNAWLLRTNEAGRVEFVVDGLRRADVLDHKVWSEQRRKQMAEEAKKAEASGEKRVVRFDWDDRSVLTAQWRPADARKDLEKLIAAFGDGAAADGASSAGRQREMMSRYMIENAGPSVVLLAAQFHRQGFTNEANRIMEQLNARAPDSRKLIVQAVSLIADSQYDTAFEEFQRTNDWAKYETALRDLGARFASGWPNGPLMARLADLVKQRRESPEPPPLAGLSEEDRFLARELALADPGPRGYVRELWVLPQDREEPWEASSNAIQRIAARGVASVPLLLALFDDPFLTRIPLSDYRGHTYYSSSDDELSDEELERRFDSMERPARRCDLARHLLAKVLPVPDERRYSGQRQSPEELREEVVAWYATVSNKSPAELQALYLEQGGEYQRREVIQNLISGLTSNSDVTAIEKFLIEGDDPTDAFGSVQQYVSKRGPAAKEFVAKYVAKLEKWEPEADEGEDSTEMRAQALASITNSLFRMISGAGTAELLADILESGSDFEGAGELYEALSREAPSNALVQVLTAAGKATNATTRLALLEALGMLRHLAQRGPDGRYERDAQPQLGSLADHAALWRPLLTDTNEAGETSGWEPSVTISQRCCLVIESLYARTEEANKLGKLESLGARGIQFVCERVAARLAGTPPEKLAPWPDADAVTEEQRDALAARLLGSKTLTADLEGLSLSERLVLRETCNDRPELAARLRPHSLTISAVDAEVALLPDLAAAVQKLKGQPLNSNTVATLRRLCESVVVTGRAVNCWASRQPDLSGVRLAFTVAEPSADGDMAGFNPFASLGKASVLTLNASLQSEGQSGHAFWRIDAPAPVAKPAADVPAGAADMLDEIEDQMSFMFQQMGEGEEEFWETLRGLETAESSPCSRVWLSIAGQPPVTPKEGEKPKSPGRRIYRSPGRFSSDIFF